MEKHSLSDFSRRRKLNTNFISTRDVSSESCFAAQKHSAQNGKVISTIKLAESANSLLFCFTREKYLLEVFDYFSSVLKTIKTTRESQKIFGFTRRQSQAEFSTETNFK